MKKLILSAALAIVLVLSFGAASAHAANVTGWAWSSNIGWIQFDTGVASPVTIDTTTGSWAGYAWSSNIGWIDFNSTSCGPQATLSISTGNVSGWAKALSANGNGWDGCIELAGTNHATGDTTGNGGVTMITSTGAFVGYAWGGSVVGWVQFNPSLGSTVCTGCSGGGAAPVIAASCSALTPTTNLAPNTPVTYKITPGGGVAPYLYSWEGQASTSASTYIKSYPSSSVNGPVARMGDNSSPVKGYSTAMVCPGVSVIAPLGASNLHINRGTSPSTPSFNTLNINQGVATPFNLNWNITLTSDYSCTASIGNDPGLANWNAGWKSIVLDSTNGTDNGDGTITWHSDTAANLTTPASGLNVGAYPFTLTCTGGAMGTQTTTATLRLTSTSENEF
jgi:hypothetical protein